MLGRWRDLPAEQAQAAGAAVALVLSMFLPWYQTSTPAVDAAGNPTTIRDTLTAFGVFTFVEAAVLLVAGAVLYLLHARTQGRAFHLPGGDGWAITVAGAWASLLLVWRFFDKPDVENTAVGIAWGSFVALGLAVSLALAGQRVRAAGRPEPQNPMEDAGWEQPDRSARRRRDRRRPADPDALTEVLRDAPPTWEGDPPDPPGRARPAEPKPPPPPGRLF